MLRIDSFGDVRVATLEATVMRSAFNLTGLGYAISHNISLVVRALCRKYGIRYESLWRPHRLEELNRIFDEIKLVLQLDPLVSLLQVAVLLGCNQSIFCN